jgi:hypothetical protein
VTRRKTRKASSRDEAEKLVADKLPLTLDKDGNGKVTIKNCRR